MGLKVELKAGERFILGECLVTNGSQRTRLLIEGDAPILREKDIMTTRQADTPAKRIYLAVQLMYTARDPRLHHETYFILMQRARAGCAERVAAHRRGKQPHPGR